MRDKAICIFGWNRPNYAYITLNGLKRVQGIENYDIWICVDGDGGHDSEYQELINQNNGFIRRIRLKSLHNVAHSTAYVFSKGYEWILSLDDDLLLTTDSLEYLNTCNYEPDIFSYALVTGMPRKQQWFTSMGAFIHEKCYKGFYDYYASQQYLFQKFPGDDRIMSYGHSQTDSTFGRYVIDSGMFTMYADKDYLGHFGVRGVNQYEYWDALEAEIFKGSREQWIDNVVRLFSLSYPLCPYGFQYR